MLNRFKNQPGLNSPAHYAFSITPSDTVDMQELVRAVSVGTGENLKVVMEDGSAVVFAAVQTGTILPVHVR